MFFFSVYSESVAGSDSGFDLGNMQFMMLMMIMMMMLSLKMIFTFKV